SALGTGRRRGRVLEAAERRVDRRLAAATGDAQGDLRAGRRARHAPREVVRALDRLALEGDDDVAGPHPSGMLTLTATPMPQSLPRPMLASLDEAPLADPRFAYEPKYDGIRALAMVRAGDGPGAHGAAGAARAHLRQHGHDAAAPLRLQARGWAHALPRRARAGLGGSGRQGAGLALPVGAA